jgi:ketosteroid isomerase-like protein
VSEENMEIVRRGVEQWIATLEWLEDVFAPNWILDLIHATRVPDHLPYYEGMAGWRVFWSIWIEQFELPSFELLGIYDADDRLVTITRQRSVAKASRTPVEQVNGIIWTVRGGLITRGELYNGAADEALKSRRAGGVT